MKYILLALFSVSAVACESYHSLDCFRDVKYVRNYDADSLTFDIPNVHPILGKKIAIRVLGVDTPEIRGETACEKALAKEARDYVRSLLKTAKRIDLTELGRGKYFRLTARVSIDGKDLSGVLIKEKFAYEYWGKTKRKIDWCTFRKK